MSKIKIDLLGKINWKIHSQLNRIKIAESANRSARHAKLIGKIICVICICRANNGLETDIFFYM